MATSFSERVREELARQASRHDAAAEERWNAGAGFAGSPLEVLAGVDAALAAMRSLEAKTREAEDAVVRPAFAVHADKRYAVADLLIFDDRQFVDIAYLATLGRSADEEGRHNYLAHLRSGMPKHEVLDHLRSSPEGRGHGAEIEGLSTLIANDKRYRIPLLGRILRAMSYLGESEERGRSRRIREGSLAAQAEVREEASRRLREAALQAIQAFAHALRAQSAFSESLGRRIQKLEGRHPRAGEDHSAAGSRESHGDFGERVRLGHSLEVGLTAQLKSGSDRAAQDGAS